MSAYAQVTNNAALAEHNQFIRSSPCLSQATSQQFLKRSTFNVVTQAGSIIACSISFQQALFLKRSLASDCCIKFAGMENSL